MKTGAQLVAAVVAKVQDPDVTTAIVLAAINEGIDIMAAELDLSHLNTVGTVTTVVGATTADLPADCTQGIYFAKVGTAEVEIYDSWADLYFALSDLDDEGQIQGIAVDGDQLRYYPAPAEATEVTIWYHRAPARVTELLTTDLFTGREAPSGEEALIQYAAMSLYDDIEDGVEGQKVNTQRHEHLFNVAWRECKILVRQGPRRPQPPRNKLW